MVKLSTKLQYSSCKKKYKFQKKKKSRKFLNIDNTKQTTSLKSSKSQLSKHIRFPTQTERIPKIWSKQKKISERM